MSFVKWTLLAIPILLCQPGCKRNAAVEQRSEPGSSPNLLLITIDTLRADHVGCYGYKDAKTPAIDALADRGIRFTRAYAHTPLTLPSHATLLTGLLPMTTGLHVNGSGLGGGALPTDLPTLATLLQSRGYRTGAFVSAAVLSNFFGLNRGFDVYEDRWAAPDVHTHDSSTHVERRGDQTRELVEAWLSKSENKPFFAWVHFFDPHHPYEPPPLYREQFAQPYDGEIAFVDAQVAALLAHLEKLKLDRNTVVMLIGDHGEGLGEHDETEHGMFVYDTTLHVPFIIFRPGMAEANHVVETPVGLADVLPTILPLMKQATPDGLDGRDLAPTWQGESIAAVPLYTESEYAHWAFGWAPLYALVTARWKYIDAPRPELFDLSVDPAERQNVLTEHPQIAAEMRSVIAEIRGRKSHRKAAPVQFNEVGRSQLAALGYVGSPPKTTESPQQINDLRDPKDMLSIYYALMRGMDRLHRGDFATAVEILEPLAKGPQAVTGFSDSAVDETLANLGNAYLGAKRFPDAEQVFVASLRSAPEDGERLTGLAIAQRSQGHLDAALETLQKAALLAPVYPDIQRELASIFTHTGHMEKAIEHWRRFGELAPTSAHAQTNLGSALIAVGKPGEAVGPLLQAIKLDPKNEYAYRSLWRALHDSGKRTEAIASLRAARRLFPDESVFMCALARLLSTTSGMSAEDLKEGLELAQRCAGSDMKNPLTLDTLALALAANGDFKKAVGMGEMAKNLAESSNRPVELQRIEKHLAAFRSGKAVIE